MQVPEDILAHIATFGRLSTWRMIGRFDVRWVAVCKIQRAWREHCALSRFVMGAVVRMRAKDDQTGMVARLVGRIRRGRDSESWTARLVRPGYHHYIYVRRVNDPTYSITERVNANQFVRTFLCA